MKSDFSATTDDSNEKLFWNNRKYHGFIAYTVDGSGEDTFTFDETEKDGKKVMVFDMAEWAHRVNSDPLLAVAQRRPAAGTNEANKVNLVFEHQFSLIQVNVKPDNTSVGDGEQLVIDKIELTGLAKEGYIYTTFSEDRVHTATGCSQPTEITEESPEDGTISVMMCDANGKKPGDTDYNILTDNTGVNATGYAIGCGSLKSIRVYWHEKGDTEENNMPHESYFNFDPKADEGIKKSPKFEQGKKYIYNFTLKRGTIATINPIIVPWEEDETDYSAGGFIKK